MNSTELNETREKKPTHEIKNEKEKCELYNKRAIKALSFSVWSE